MKTNRFTLIELLVVIAIIAMMAAMLLPALGRVKDTGATKNCQNNIKQMGMACLLYANDHGDYLPFAKKTVGGVNYGAYISDGWYWQNSLTNIYLKAGKATDKVRNCPETVKRLGYVATRTTYGMNGNMAAGTMGHGGYEASYNKTPLRRVSGIQYPARGAMMVENRGHGTWDGLTTSTTSGTDTHFVHGNMTSANVVFVDGHSETRKLNGIVCYRSYPNCNQHTRLNTYFIKGFRTAGKATIGDL